ncbi:hypothetical protein HHA01_00510 [Halomonas halmophila]|uniref:Uncharacterized protein n=1 Tax=Halomonas halmophila TaxID=252 RepID=A0A4Y4EZS6_9GAMM|nr:hypothetical protein HHA01_00510 [Halomonas halmophila]
MLVGFELQVRLELVFRQTDGKRQRLDDGGFSRHRNTGTLGTGSGLPPDPLEGLDDAIRIVDAPVTDGAAGQRRYAMTAQPHCAARHAKFDELDGRHAYIDAEHSLAG